MFHCAACGASFTRKAVRDQHVFRVHGEQPRAYDCTLCGEVFSTLLHLRSHIFNHRSNTDFYIIQTNYKHICTVYEKKYAPAHPSIEHTIEQDLDKIVTIMKMETASKLSVKFNIVTTAIFVKYDMEDIIQDVEHVIRNSAIPLGPYVDHQSIADYSISFLKNKIEDFQENGSNWNLYAILNCRLEFGQCQSLSGRCGTSCIIKSKKDLLQYKIYNGMYYNIEKLNLF